MISSVGFAGSKDREATVTIRTVSIRVSRICSLKGWDSRKPSRAAPNVSCARKKMMKGTPSRQDARKERPREKKEEILVLSFWVLLPWRRGGLAFIYLLV